MELKNIEQSINIVEEVMKGSIAEELEIEPGDILVSVNGQEIKDIIDYKYIMTDDFVTILIQKQDGEVWELEIEKEYDEDIGISFTNPLIDKAKSCRNNCIFCFIDQLPKGMRETLYFKDDDSRLSFLQGNFITLTNLSDEEIDRIIKYRISPINISVHTTNPELRKKMLNNKNAGRVYEILKKFNEVNIEMNCQIVLVPNVNDKEELSRTLDDLYKLYPNVNSVAVVPIGITKYRDGLKKVDIFNNKTSNELLDLIENKQSEFLKSIGTRFVFASDEFFVLANREAPKHDDYEGFAQIENGVGLMRSFQSEVEDELEKIEGKPTLNKEYIIPTGTIAYEFMKKITSLVMEKFDGLNIKVIPIKNNFFGETITVTGLITGNDLIDQLKNEDLKDGILITKSMLKADEDIFLDNVTLEELKERLNTQVTVAKVDGKEFVDIFRK
ncbi:hypothetical protein DUF512 [Gottschalkia acidurici 9a]|uniref:PDZ domain-containing protein n=1 Tax=Gottschalkia acidurici (strain ATCC 7906 / DSM 604 / BCRC 14475 / CIP 104303 / KCTC 5404 / NCIMB 10678 / 9a) TaxID=1128398 RepID=K0AZM4_GOTA9|nr:radical SAM protein [Gottschalkia acidurici]AFS78724.1 hypothetical protein DUF512 [Gottschalkia acidurici 9a]